MSAGLARAFGSLARGFAGGMQLGSQLNEQKERTQTMKDANDRRRAQDDAFAQLADLAEGYVGPGMPATYKPAGAAALAAGGIGSAPTLPDVPIDTSAPRTMPSARAPEPQGEGPKTPEQRLGYALWRQPALLQSREFFDKAAAIMLRTPGMGEDGLRWLLRGAQIQKENGVEALKKLAAGDAQGAAAAFNASGDVKIDPGSLKPLDGGKWQATIAGTGQVRTFDPLRELRMTLSPKDYFDLSRREVADKAKAEDRATMRTEQATHNRNTEEILRMNADTRRTLGEARLERGPLQNETALQRNTRHLVSIGAAKSEADAYQLMRQAGGKPEREGIAALAKVLLSRPGYFGPQGTERAFADAAELYRSIGAQQQPPGAPRPAGPAPAAPAFRSADDVRAAFRAGRLPRDQAESILRDQFGYEK